MKTKLVLTAATAALLTLAACKKDGESGSGFSVKINPDAKDTLKIVDYATDPQINKDTKAFLKVLNAPGGKPLETMTPKDARQVLVGAQASVNVDVSGIDESEKTISVDNFNIKLNIVRPKGNTQKLPVFMFIHGGGWVLGDYPTHKRFVRDLVVLSGYVAVFVNYTPSPEAKYPTAINEIYAATKWVAEHGDEINVDGKRLAVVGNSVGGNMAAVTAIKAKEGNGPEIKTQVLFWPITDANFETLSYLKYGKDRFLTSSLMQWMFDQYTTDPKQRKERYASPLQATTEQLKGLPPALVIVAENDILHDDGVAYGRKLDAAGVATTTVVYKGVIHDFGLLNALANQPATRSALQQAADQLKKYLK
jgi:acetyl esterase/lipase